jgi:hypothetical protein
MKTTPSPFLTVPFAGDIELIKEFYKLLGVRMSSDGLVFQNFEIVFSAAEGLRYQLVVTVDEDLDALEAELAKKGGVVIDSGFDVSGPFMIVRDPAGLSVRIDLTPEGMARAIKAARRFP